jgi:hypothetical protein
MDDPADPSGASPAPPPPPEALPLADLPATCEGRIDEDISLGIEVCETETPEGERAIHIQRVEPDGAAVRAVPELEEGMLLVAVDGEPVTGLPYDDVLARVSACAPIIAT